MYFAKVERAPEHKTVFFLRPAAGEFATLCISSRKRDEHGNRCHSRGCGSYTVVVATGKVVRMCFSSKCKSRCGGKTVLIAEQDVPTSEDDSEFESTEEEEDEDDKEPAAANATSRKRQRADT